MSLDWLKSRVYDPRKTIANQVAKQISHDDFLLQLEDTWLSKWLTTKGAIDVEAEMIDIKKRIKKSGYQRTFDNAKITDQDLEITLREAIKKSGRSERGR